MGNNDAQEGKDSVQLGTTHETYPGHVQYVQTNLGKRRGTRLIEAKSSQRRAGRRFFVNTAFSVRFQDCRLLPPVFDLPSRYSGEFTSVARHKYQVIESRN